MDQKASPIGVTPAAGRRPPAPRMPTPTLRGALYLVAALLGLYALHFAREVFIPLALGVLISFALSPVVTWWERRHVPRAVGAALLLLLIAGLLGFGSYTLSDNAAALIEDMPRAARLLQERLKQNDAARAPIERVQEAADALQGPAARPRRAAPPAPPPAFDIREYLWWGTKNLVAAGTQVVIVFFLVYFLLASGDLYKRKLVKIFGPSFAQKKVTLAILDEIQQQIERYLLILLVTGLLVGVTTWLAFLWLGVNNAAVWGLAAGVLNGVPYIGPLMMVGAAGLAGFLQFESVSMAAAIAGVSLVITALEGYALLPWLTGKASHMNAVAVFVGLLLWGWLWGAWGFLLAAPILMVVKVISDHVEPLRPVGELLGE
jgi:predicted PurR-regulated permease PerM